MCVWKFIFPVWNKKDKETRNREVYIFRLFGVVIKIHPLQHGKCYALLWYVT